MQVVKHNGCKQKISINKNRAKVYITTKSKELNKF